MEVTQLNAGEFMGEVREQRALKNYILTLTQHESHGKVPPHEHEFPYISLLLSGNYQERSTHDFQEIIPGSSLFRPGNYEHENRLGEHQGLCFNLEIKKEIFTEKLKSLGESAHFFERLNLEISKIHFGFHNGLSDELLNILIEENLYLLFTRSIPDYSIGKAHWISQVKKQVHDFPERPYSIDSVAKDAAVHPVYFVRKFKEKTGITFGEFLVRARLEHAVHLMLHSKKNLTEISLEAGFFDQSHFIKHFRAAFGTTPSDYRQALKG